MAKKKKTLDIEKEAAIEVSEITRVLETNYMPYAMTVIVSRAIPEIDGFKPSHRKILYTMYKMGLLTGNRTKSANVVGATMKLHPHGDLAIYETLVRLTAARKRCFILCGFKGSRQAVFRHGLCRLPVIRK